jgi:alkylation response protein AidB-like acyl-CoA dehydrogenase
VPGHKLTAARGGNAVTLDGTKPWCSGARLCSHALVTARGADGNRGLFAVDLAHRGVAALASSWHNAGMADSDTRSVRFDDVPATPVGAPGDYLDRPGFWHGAIGVAACWLGGARAVAAPLYRKVAEHEGKVADPHAQAHLGAVDAALAATEAILTSAAEFVDAEPASGRTELMARRVRAVAETAVDEAIVRTGRALGPAPLALNADHARRVADLTMYVRQSHAERDLAALGRLACEPASEVAVI